MLLGALGLKELPGTASSKELQGVLASLLGARMLLRAPGLKELPDTASSKELLGAPGIATSKDAGSWPEGTTRHC